MTKKLLLVAAFVLFAGNLLLRAQESEDRETTQQNPKSQAAPEKSAKEQVAEKKTENNLTDYPFDFPEAQGPVELRPARGTRITLKMTDSSRAVYESIGKQAKIDVLFDPDYTPRTLSVELNGASLQDALKIVAFESHTFWRPVTSEAIFVAADNNAKRHEFQQQLVTTFYFPNIHTPTDLQDIVNSMRTIVEVQRIQQIPSHQSILVRATPEQMALVERIVDELNQSKQKTEGQYRLEYKINETTAESKVTSRTYTLLVEPRQIARLRIGPAVQVQEAGEKEKKYLDSGKNIESQVRVENEHSVSLHLNVAFPEADENAHAASADSSLNTQQAMMETTVTLELGKPTNVGSFQDPVNKHSFQIEAMAVRTRSNE